MQNRRIGEVQVGAIGLGEMPMSIEGRPDESRSIATQQVCLAWMLARSPVVIPIPGSSRPETIRDSAAATQLTLADDDIAELDATGRAA